MEFGQKDESWMLPIYREMGYFITRREQYDRALPHFDEALRKVPNDKRTFLGRSWARSKVCKYEGAMEDIKKALEMDPDDLMVTAQKSLNLYLCCEFEKALVLNYQMVPKRKKPDHFTIGVMQCNEAIENTIGLRTGHPLRDHYKIVRRIAWKKIKEVEDPYAIKRKRKKKKPKVGRPVVKEPVIPDVRHHEERLRSLKEELCILESLHSFKPETDYIPPCVFPYRPKQRYTTNIENYMAERYLDRMYMDKIFLKELKDRPGTISPNAAGTKALIQLSKEGYKALSLKQELLRTRRPFYFLKHQEARITGAFKGRVQFELQRLQNTAKAEADVLLKKIKRAVHHRRVRVVLETAEKLKSYCELKPKKILPTRDEYLHAMYKYVAESYYQTFRINERQDEQHQAKRVQNWMGLPHSREPSNDSIIRQFKDIYLDWKKLIAVFEVRLKKATTPDEMCWLYHELARYHIELKQYELARVYCRKCIHEGSSVESNHWIVNGMMTLGRISIRQRNRNDAKSDFNNVLNVARKLGDTVLQRYISKCLDIVEKVQFDEHLGVKVVEKREKQVISLMSGAEMKDEVAFLFKKMDAMPADRRMPVMPGVKVPDAKKPSPSMKKSSIMPTSKNPTDVHIPEKLLKSSQSGDGNSDAESNKGISFMELIKFHID